MTPSGQTLCLCMIVKNEAHVIRRCLASVRPIIDHWIVVDTGSTDGTQDVVRAAMVDLPGQLIERAWIDFAHNRSEALDVARPHGAYTLIIDADDELVLPPGFAMPDLDSDFCTVDIVYGDTAYRRPQIIRSALPWRYRGVLHEFLEGPEACTQGHVPISIRVNHEGARSTDPQTYARDAEVLEQALVLENDPFLVARYTFYLAQSYRDCGKFEAALARYLARAELGFWPEEVFVSLLQAGRMKEALAHDVDAILDVYARASAVCPGRAEAAHAASRLCRLNDRFADGYAAAAPALTLVVPRDGLFVEPWIYAYGLRDEYAVNAYWAGFYDESLAACLDLLALEDLLAEHRPRIATNARFALERMKDGTSAASGALDKPANWRSSSKNPACEASASIEALVALPSQSIVIADVGAAFFGQSQAYDQLRKRGLAKLVAFEPDVRELERLRSELGADATLVPKALGDGGRHTLHLGPSESGMTSLLRPDMDYLAFFNGFSSFGAVVGTQEIDTCRLDDCDEIGEIDFIRMDIQGSELAVLRNGMSKLRDCVAVQLEVSFVPLYEKQPTFGDVDGFMRQAHYLPHCFSELKRWSIAPTIRAGSFRVPFNQLLEADLVYIKDIVKRDIDDLQLKKLAVIAHYCYGSHDLAARCLRILVERQILPQGTLDAYHASLSLASYA